VSDPLPGLSAITPESVDSLAPGDSQEFTATYTITQDDVDAGSVDNTATATGTFDDVEYTATDSETVTGPAAAPAIDLDKSASPGTYSAEGDVITYTFVVTNTGNVTLTDVSVSDPLPGLSAITPESVDSLAPGDSQEFTATYTITQDDVDAGSVDNTATATGTFDDVEYTATDSETVTGPAAAPAIDLDKSASPGTYSAEGDVITYTFVVTNTGNVTLTDVRIDDVKLDISGLAVEPSTLEPGETGTATATYTITQDDVDAGSVLNTALATGTDPNEETVTAEDDETIRAQYTLTMVVSPSGGGTTIPEVGSHIYVEGTVIEIEATANPGYVFNSWTGDVENPTSESTTVTMNADKTVTAYFDKVVTISAIEGVTPPFAGEIPVTVITETDQYTGTVSWEPAHSTFAPGTEYTATITLSAKDGYTFDGVSANFFTVAGATTVSNTEDSGIVTAVFSIIPVAVADSYNIGLETEINILAPGVLANDSGDDGAELKAFLEDAIDPDVGELIFNVDGSFEFTVGEDWDGLTTFTYRTCDGEICSASATVTIEEADYCLLVTSDPLEMELQPDSTGTLDFLLTNNCDVPVDYDILESGGVTGIPVLSERFENEANPTIPPNFPPDDWTKILNSDRSWMLTEGSAFVDEGQFAAWVIFYDPEQQDSISDEWLISSVIDTTGHDDLVLTFRANGLTYYKGATLRVWVTDADGTPITAFSDEPLWDMLRDVDWMSRKFRTVQVDLGEFDRYGEIRIAWQYVTVDANDRGESFGLDDIEIGSRSDISWLSLTINRASASGTLPARDNLEITIDFDAKDLLFGSYEGMLFVRNAPYRTIDLPVYLQVMPKGDFRFFLPLINK